MAQNRRRFLVRSAMAAGSTAVIGGAAWAHAVAPKKSAAAISPALSRALFDSWLGVEFKLYAPHRLRAQPARLYAVHAGPEFPGLEQFEADFDMPEAVSGLCRLVHPDGTQLELRIDALAATPAVPTLARATFCLVQRGDA